MRLGRESLAKSRERFDAYIAAERAKSEADEAELKRFISLLWRSAIAAGLLALVVWLCIHWLSL